MCISTPVPRGGRDTARFSECHGDGQGGGGGGETVELCTLCVCAASAD